MSRTLLFTLASKANEAQKRSEENTVELMRKLDEGEITESQFDDALYDESNKAFISEGAMQNGIAEQMSQLLD